MLEAVQTYGWRCLLGEGLERDRALDFQAYATCRSSYRRVREATGGSIRASSTSQLRRA